MYPKWMRALVGSTVVLSIVFVAGCFKFGTDKESPQGTLSEYISRSFAIKAVEEKARLIELTSGEVRGVLESMAPDAFKRYFIDSKREFVSMKIKDERKLAENRYSITYELSYINTSSESKDQVTNKKHAIIILDGSHWRIDEVRNLKTFIEHQNEISF